MYYDDYKFKQTGKYSNKVPPQRYLVAEFQNVNSDTKESYISTASLFVLQRSISEGLVQDNTPDEEKRLYEDIKAYNALKDDLDKNPKLKARYGTTDAGVNFYDKETRANLEKGVKDKYKDVDFKYESLLDYE